MTDETNLLRSLVVVVGIRKIKINATVVRLRNTRYPHVVLHFDFTDYLLGINKGEGGRSASNVTMRVTVAL